jgi:hypothetical protein
LRDAEHDLWIFQPPGTPTSASYAIDGNLEQTEVIARTVASSLRPPTAWAVSQAVGTLLALGVAGIAFTRRRRAESWRAGRTGAHRGQGWVTFEDGTPPTHFSSAATVHLGNVLVVEPSRLTQNYREHGRVEGAARIAAGTFDQVLQAADTRATDLYLLATLVALLTLAPMLAAALQGLLG